MKTIGEKERMRGGEEEARAISWLCLLSVWNVPCLLVSLFLSVGGWTSPCVICVCVFGVCRVPFLSVRDGKARLSFLVRLDVHCIVSFSL